MPDDSQNNYLNSLKNLMEQKDKYYLYVTGILDNPILKSQVLNWIEVLQGQGIVFDILSCPSIPYLVRHGSRQRAIVREFRGRLQGRIYQAVTFRSLDRFDLISPLIKALRILFIIFKEGRKRRIDCIVLQSRSGINYKTFRLLKKISRRIKVVFDFRGAAPEEYLNSLSIDSIAAVTDPEIIKEYRRCLSRDAEMMNIGDMIYCVSNSLRDYLLKLHEGEENDGKICVVPGAADESIFYHDPRLGLEKRKAQRLENRKIAIYTGRLKNNYHKKELVFEFAAMFVARDKANYFICLTPDIDMANELKAGNSISVENILIQYINDPAEINAFLNAADLGIILRDNVMTNRVASPTKLAEYLLAGLPVLASDHIGDYSEFIRENRLGCVVNNDIEELLVAAGRFRFTPEERAKNSTIAGARFSKQANIDAIRAALDQL
jgi:glycosyltransferase involved in cell wall biosynthesis